MKEKISLVKEKLKHLKEEREAVLVIEPQDRQKYQKAAKKTGSGAVKPKKSTTTSSKKGKASKQPRF